MFSIKFVVDFCISLGGSATWNIGWKLNSKNFWKIN